jgi:hypothetical protein
MRTTFQRHLAISPRDYRLRVSKGGPLPRDACAAQRSAGAPKSHNDVVPHVSAREPHQRSL